MNRRTPAPPGIASLEEGVVRESFPRPVEPLTVALAVLSSAAAGIHGTLTSTHAREHWLLGVSFAVGAAYQLAWAFVALV
ncbi:MAG: hypothetical protein H0W27_04780, partial [Actinobacteria bacterium]|nr:hypothetical protein [Actinomycetota bacterium]